VVNQTLIKKRPWSALRGKAMFDTVILLMDKDFGVVERPFLGRWLRQYNPFLTIISVFTLAQLRDLEPGIFQRARLIAFAASVIVPKSILAELRYGAYNFHPGPPEYPGSRPGRFALADGRTEFGVTAHAMVEQVDAGPIVRVNRFRIAPGESIAALNERSYVHLAIMFRSLAKALATQAEPLPRAFLHWTSRKKQTRLDIVDPSYESVVFHHEVLHGSETHSNLVS
jgi:methionyl-tRNA formyltransferase